MTHHQRAAALAAIANRVNAQKRAEAYRWFLAPLADSGLSLRELARTMNAYCFKPPIGDGQWHANTVRRTLQRLGLYGQEAA